MEIVVGAPVTGENLHGRERELDVLWPRTKNNSILLSSPRRFGKTSLVKEMERDPRDGFEIVYMEVEGVNSLDDFVVELACALPKPARRALLKRLGEKIKENVEEFEAGHLRVKLREGPKEDWKSRGSELFSMLRDSQKESIIVIDEMPSFLLNLEAQSRHMGMFLRWLRQIRQTHGTRFILCGSIGIDNILRRHVLSSTINDLERITVSPFQIDAASRMAERLLGENDIKHEPAHVRRILGKIGVPTPPYFLQAMLHEVVKMASESGKTSESIVDKAYQSMLSEGGRKYFDRYYERLGTEFPPDRLPAVKSMLDHLSQHEPCTKSEISRVFFNALGKRDDEAFIEAVRILEDGFYVTRDRGYSFRVKVLRDWWSERRAV